MAEINLENRSRTRTGVKRIKKANLKIDMTPMVDLGFLLISFFIFTTEISKPRGVKLYMPKDGDSTNIPQSKSLTILLGNNNEIFCYKGDMSEAINNHGIFQTSYDEINGIGSVIRQKQNELVKRKIDKKELTVLIKPCVSSSYKNMVDALDEMLINDVTQYVIADPEREEKVFLEHPNGDR
jgi:biopolymer transport protein ExbD